MTGLLLAAIIELAPGTACVAPGGKLAHVEAVSTVAAGTVSVMSEVSIETNAVETVALAPGAVWTNAAPAGFAPIAIGLCLAPRSGLAPTRPSACALSREAA